MKKMLLKYPILESNLQPLEQESTPTTIRTGLPPEELVYKGK